MATQIVYYYIPKERVANLLNTSSRQRPDGSIECEHSYATIMLTNYLIPSEIIATPLMRGYVGKIGTKAVINHSYESIVRDAKKYMDTKLKDYEL